MLKNFSTTRKYLSTITKILQKIVSPQNMPSKRIQNILLWYSVTKQEYTYLI